MIADKKVIFTTGTSLRCFLLYFGFVIQPWLPTPSQLQRFPAAGSQSETQQYECHLSHQSSEHQHPEISNRSRNKISISILSQQADRCLNNDIRGFLTLSNSTTVSAKPTTYMATATALANAKISPMEPPNSGPRLLEIR